MTVYYGQCLSSTLQEPCPGEEGCPKLRERAKHGEGPDLVCPACVQRYSKPGYFEAEIVLADTERVEEWDVQSLAHRAFEMDAVQRSGWAAKYEWEPTIGDWVALRGLANARAKFESEQAKPKPKTSPTTVPQTPEQAKEAAREKMVGQMRQTQQKQRR